MSAPLPEPASAQDTVDTVVAQWRHERPDLDPSPIALFGRVHRIYLRYQAALSKTFEAHGLNAAAFDVLASLRRGGAPYRKSGKQLATGSLLTSAGVTFRLDRLEGAGLIERQRDDQDRRVVYSTLTPEGFDVIERAMDDHLRTEHAMLEGLTERECAQLVKLLAKLERSIVESGRGER